MKRIQKIRYALKSWMYNQITGRLAGDSKLLVEMLLLVIVAGLVIGYRTVISGSFTTLFTNLQNSLSSMMNG